MASSRRTPSGTSDKGPKVLAALRAFAMDHEGRLPGDLHEVEGTPLAAFFPKAPQLAARFTAVCVNESGGVFALWQKANGTALSDSPLVYFDHEFIGTGVVAGSLAEFVAIIASGVRELGDPSQWEPMGRLAPGSLDLEFRRWALEELGIEHAAAPLEIVQRAREEHGELLAWLAEAGHRTSKQWLEMQARLYADED